MAGLLDNIDEDKIANLVMANLGFEDDTTSQSEITDTQSETKDQVESTEEETEEVDLDEADNRLAKAQLYRQFITGKIFDGNGLIVNEVEKEFQDFARKRLQILLGLLPQESKVVVQAKLPFDEDEIKVLKILIDGIKIRILKDPSFVKPKTNKQPKLRPITTPIPSAGIPEPKKVETVVAKKPQLKLKQVPEEVSQQQPKPKKTVIQPVDKTVSKSTTSLINSSHIPNDDTVVEENGTKFKIKHVAMSNIDEYGIMDGAKIRALDNKKSATLSNGIQVFKDGDEVFKILKTQISNVTSIPGRVPFPSIAQMNAMSEAIATQQSHAYESVSISKILGR